MNTPRIRCGTTFRGTEIGGVGLAERRRRLAAGGSLPAHEALALLDAAGGRLAARAVRRAGRAERDKLIRELAARHLTGLTPTAAAHRIAELANTYTANAWLRDRGRATLPEYLRGKPQEYLWRAFIAHSRFPFSPRQILTILQSQEGNRAQNKTLAIARGSAAGLGPAKERMKCA